MTNPARPGRMLVTGAAGGMGSASALLAAERGYALLLSDLDEGKLRSLAAACARKGVTADYRVLDIANPAAVDAFMAELADGDALDAVIHAVGLSPNMAAWDRIIQVDLVGTIALLEKLKPAIKPGGCALCIASMSAHMVPADPAIAAALGAPLAAGLLDRLQALPGEPLANSGIAYAYAKQALLDYVTREAGNWGKEGKRLVSISPGLIDTDMGRLEADSDQDTYAALRPLIALQRDGQPQEIASAALFLVSDSASYITGCDLLVDGGCVAAFAKMQQQPPST